MKPLQPPIAINKKARFDYAIEETFEAGIAFFGWEVKSARNKRVQLMDSYVHVVKGELWLVGAHISPIVSSSTHTDKDPMRPRKLLMKKKEIDRLIGLVEQKGVTLLALELYAKKHLIKAKVGIAKGKKKHDKRRVLREKTIMREQSRELKKY